MSDPARRLSDLLIEPRETLDVELKQWLEITTNNDHKAVLAKALIALANHGGGYVIIGLLETAGGAVESPGRPDSLAVYNPNSVNAIAVAYAEPAFHCDVQIAAAPGGLLYPIVSVPGRHRVPIRSRRDGPAGQVVKNNCYYIRRPGPQSEVPQTGREWDDLIRRCIANAREEILDQMRSIFSSPTPPSSTALQVTGAPIGPTSPATAVISEQDVNTAVDANTEERDSLETATSWFSQSFARWEGLTNSLPPTSPVRLPLGHFAFSYVLDGNIQIKTGAELLQALSRAKVSHTGWSEFWLPTRDEIRPYPYEGNIECWIARDGQDHGAAHNDFWRVSPDGKLFLIRGYQEDEPAVAERGLRVGTKFDLTIPTWRFGEALLHASNMATQLGDPAATISMVVEWTGLRGRTLTHLEGTRLIFDDQHQSHQDGYRGTLVARADRVSDALPELVGQVMRPLYELFDFFRLPDALPAQELTRMRSNRF